MSEEKAIEILEYMLEDLDYWSREYEALETALMVLRRNEREHV